MLLAHKPTFVQWFARLVFQAMQTSGKGYRRPKTRRLPGLSKPAGAKIAAAAKDHRIGKVHP